MKLAVISDIHGHGHSLDLVLEAIDAEGIRDIVCLGDVALGGYDPRRSIQQLMLRGIPTLKGNTDARILERDPYQPDDAAEAARERDWLNWTIDQLGTEELAFLESLPPTIDLEIGGIATTASHGSPRSFYDPVLPETDDATLETWFASTDAQVMLVGHTHQQILRRWNGRTIINPGPITLTIDGLKSAWSPIRPRTEYAVITAENGAFDVQFRRIPIDPDAFMGWAYGFDVPHPEAWIARAFAGH